MLWGSVLLSLAICTESHPRENFLDGLVNCAAVGCGDLGLHASYTEEKMTSEVHGGTGVLKHMFVAI